MQVDTVTVAEQLKMDLDDAMLPKRVEMPQPNTGFAALDNPESVPAPESQPGREVAPKVDVDHERRKALIMDQAQRMQAERQQFAQERAQHAQDLKELARYRDLKARAKEDPVGIAEEFGYEPDKYATTLVEKGALTPEKRRLIEQAQEIKDLKSWRAQQEQQAQANQQQTLQNQVFSEFEQFAASRDGEFDLVHRTKSYDKVLAKIVDHHRRTSAMGEPETLPPEVAFAQVEKELEDYYAPVLESPKIRSRMASQYAESDGPAASSPQQAARKPAGTINSKMRSGTGQVSAPPQKKMTEQERMKAAGDIVLNQIYGRR